MTIKYKRVLLKLSGEALQGQASNLDPTILDRLATDIKTLVDLGVQVGVVVGGGNLFRGAELATAGINRVKGDQMGMLATAMNGLAITDALDRAGAQSLIMSSIPLQGISDAFCHTRAIAELESNRVVVFVGGTGNPFFTTDSAACLRGIEIQADVVLKATKVDGVYTADPAIHADAERYHTLSFDTVLQKELKVMDMAAFVLARDHDMPIRVFNMKQNGVLQQIVMGDEVGTLIHPEGK